jgi:hypothetical protein
VTFQCVYEGLASAIAPANPQLTARVTNSTPTRDEYDLSLVVWNDTAKFNLARLDAAGVSGIRNVDVEGDVLTAVSSQASSFFKLSGGTDRTPSGIRLPQDNLAGVGVRDYAPNGYIQALSIQAVAFGSHTRQDGTIETGAAAHQDDAARLLSTGTAIVQANDTFRVPFADLPTQQVQLFFDTDPNGGHFDDDGIILEVEAVVTATNSANPAAGNTITPSNVARGAATALVTVVPTYDKDGHLQNSVVKSIEVRGDGASIQTQQWISDHISSTGPLGDLILQSGQGITNVTAPSIFGSIIVTTSVVQVNGLSGALITRGNLISQVTVNGPGLSGLLAVQGNVNESNTTDDDGHVVRLGGLVVNGGISGQVVVLGTVFADVIDNGGLKDGRIVVKGNIPGNLTINGDMDPQSAVVTAGSIGSGTAGTVMKIGNVKGILAAEGSILFDHTPNTNNAAYYAQNISTSDPTSATAISAIFTQTGQPLGFDVKPLDLGGLGLILQNLSSLPLGSSTSAAVSGSSFGQLVTVTATVTGVLGTPSGNVDFRDTTRGVDLGLASLSGGKAVLSTTGLALAA